MDYSQFHAAFFEEVGEHLARLESGVLRLEHSPGDGELLNDMFRAAHSIKGTSGVFGFSAIAHFTHSLEEVLDALREGRVAASPALVDVILRSCDCVAGLVDAAKSGAESPADVDALIAELRGHLAPRSDATVAQTDATASQPTGSTASRTVAIRIEPDAAMFAAGADPFLLLRDLAELGELVSCRIDTEKVPALDALDPEQCYVAWDVTLRTSASDDAIREVFTFVEDSCRVVIGATHTAPIAPAADQAPERRSGGDRRVGGDRRQSATLDSSSIRVSTEKVDELINLVGELIISQSMLQQIAGTFTPEQLPRLQEAVMQMDRNVRDLQERVMSVRMLPIGALFGRFPRLVRDLAASFGKEITLEMSGEETELDKGVIERIADPLTHLVRNAVDHGVDAPATRAALGKARSGHVRLAAFHEAGNVVLEVADDGRGLDTERIRQKGIALGLIRDDEALPDERVHELIFQPGFSTAQTVSDVSGRGVGMDVVRRNIEALGGSITIHTAAGAGTRFRIKLPLTLAILDGMLIRVGDATYVLPLLTIVESLRPAPVDVRTVLGAGEVVMVRGEPLPMVRAHQVLRARGAETDPTKALVVIVERDGGRIGLLVDELLGQSQVVIKSLESNYRRVDGVMGATIMGDGHIALIIDIDGLARMAGIGSARGPARLREVA